MSNEQQEMPMGTASAVVDFTGADESKPSEWIREKASKMLSGPGADYQKEFNIALLTWLDKTFDAKGRRRE